MTGARENGERVERLPNQLEVLRSPYLAFRKGRAALPTIALAAVIAVSSGSSVAHQAATGWSYPKECCDDRDCSQIDTADVTVGNGFYKWKNHRISFNSPKVRRSPDPYFHGCEAPWWGDTSGNLEIVCFFVPTGS